jgi:GNAT superfamily N-acetyltransferase
MTTFRRARADTPPGSEMIVALLAELTQLFGWSAGPNTPSATPAELAPPNGAFLIGRRDGVPIACGGVKRLGEGLAEIKRVYVVPAARSQGVARETIGAVEDAARALGYARMRMDTHQAHGRALCLSLGYVEIADYNGNPHANFWGEKDLAAARA